ncbi:unnamed protein product [Lactuca virosa]|uniref:P-type ATPase C-terminal domain-containing protein n=1 Tax=Lactuca virosa TaxID=75947 RepID=A0AAU9LHY9_9ASTR|nr:unnamed protein product [Lactuca virosa]
MLIWGSVLCWYILLLLYGALPPIYSRQKFKLLVEAVSPAPMYWIATLLVVVVSLLPYITYMVIQRLFYPTHDQLIGEMNYITNDVVNMVHEVEELLEIIPEQDL